MIFSLQLHHKVRQNLSTSTSPWNDGSHIFCNILAETKSFPFFIEWGHFPLRSQEAIESWYNKWVYRRGLPGKTSDQGWVPLELIFLVFLLSKVESSVVLDGCECSPLPACQDDLRSFPLSLRSADYQRSVLWWSPGRGVVTTEETLQYFLQGSQCWIIEQSDHLCMVAEPVVGGEAGGAARVSDLGESNAWQTPKLTLSLPESSNTQTDRLQSGQVRSGHSPPHLPQHHLLLPPSWGWGWHYFT